MKKLVQTVGTRKKAVARATLTPGNGVVRINSKRLDTVQPSMLRLRLMEPLLIAGDVAHKINIDVNVNGGGAMGQADAGRLAIGKAIAEFAGDKMRQKLLEYDRTLLVADVRQRETRKPNRHGNARGKIAKSYR